MKYLILLLFSVAAWAADITVCTSGCTYSTMQAAIDAASPGDTITLPAGVTFASGVFELKNKPGADWITIRSSKADQLPDGYRPAIGDTRVATLAFTANGTALITLTADPAFSSNCWTTTRVGNVATFGPLHTGGLTCEARLPDGTLYTSSAPVCTVTLLGVAVSASGSSGGYGDGLRVGLGVDGKCHISHKTTIAETTHFTCTNCVGTGEVDKGYNYPASTVPLGNIGYSTAGAVTGVGDARVWLSGPQANKTDMPGLYNGTFAAAYKGPAMGVHHYRFVGVHFRYDSTVESYFGMMFFKLPSADYRYVPHHFEWDKCVFSQPKASGGFWRWIGLYHGENVLIRNTSFLNTQTRPEGQGILIVGSEGPIIMENIDIDGGTENFMSGGSAATVTGVPQVIVRRSLFRKRHEQWPLTHVVRQTSTDTLALTTTNDTTRCNAGTCTAYYENTPYVYSQDSTIVVSGGTSPKLYIGVSPTGVLTVGHNSGANVTCTGDFTCLAGITSRAGIAEYAMLYEWTGTTGVWGAASDWRINNNAVIQLKNNFEIKTGKNILIEGNIFRTYWPAGGQSNIFAAGTRDQYGYDVSTRIDGLTITRNKFASAHAGPYFFAIDSNTPAPFGRGYSMTHNILVDISKARWGNYTFGGTALTLYGWGMRGMPFQHNTAEIDDSGIFQQGYLTALNSLGIKDNLWLWSTGTIRGVGGEGVSTGYNCVWLGTETPWGIYGNIGPTSEYRGNLNFNVSTYANNACNQNPAVRSWNNPAWTDLAGQNFTNNKGIESVTYSTHLTSVSSPLVQSDDVRIKPSSVYSVQNASYAGPVTSTGMDAGADTAWNRSLTDGVNEGWPTWAQRKSLIVERDGTSATVSLTCAGETATWIVSTHQRMKSTDTGYQTGSAACGAARQTFTITSLTAGTTYWLVVEAASGVYKERI